MAITNNAAREVSHHFASRLHVPCVQHIVPWVQPHANVRDVDWAQELVGYPTGGTIRECHEVAQWMPHLLWCALNAGVLRAYIWECISSYPSPRVGVASLKWTRSRQSNASVSPAQPAAQLQSIGPGVGTAVFGYKRQVGASSDHGGHVRPCMYQ